MKSEITRRHVLKAASGLAVGAGVACAWQAPVIEDETTGDVPEKGSRIPPVGVTVPPPGPKSLALIERMQQVIGRSNYLGLYGVALVGGDGCRVQDIDGNVYLDCLAAATTNVLGYGHDTVADAYHRVAVEMQNSCFAYSPNPYPVMLAERLVTLTPGLSGKRVMFGLSGSDSNGGAIEAMRKFTGKMQLLKFDNAYHGSTGLSQQASGFRSLNEGIYPPSDDFVSLQFPTTERGRDEVLRQIERFCKQGNVGGMLTEPIQGDAGVLVPADGFFVRAAEILDNYGALFIVDEVQSGMGRTGAWWAIEHEGVAPDLMVAAKGLTGGYAPMSALVGRADVLDSLASAQQIFTYTGHGPSAAAVLEVIDIIERERVVENAAKVGRHLLERLQAVAHDVPEVVREARGRGLMIGVEIDTSEDANACKVISQRCVEKGVYVGYFGDAQQVVRIEPPLTLSLEEADLVADTLREVVEEMRRGETPEATVERVRRYAVGL
jgi:4-aminobutyrate aminotransferase